MCAVFLHTMKGVKDLFTTTICEQYILLLAISVFQAKIKFCVQASFVGLLRWV